jgi:L-fuconolactonase|uniref:amidohydrolase family protein n=1 Tax=Daejeonella sp. TaxID=2805397 RepID=UPI00404A2FA8
MEKVDAHQHFWKFDPLRDNWITEEMEVIRHDFLPHNLKPLLDANGVNSCIAVQADQSENETDFLLGLAAENEFIKGVVGWVDLCSETIHDRLEHYSQFPKIKGFRHILQAEPIEFILKPEFQRGISALQLYGFTYDILIYPQHLPVIPDLIRGGNEQKFILDHLAKPNIKNGTSATWAADLKKIASHKNVFCKLTGMVTEADHRTWTKEDIYPYMDKALEFFGPERLLFGSDWPVCRLAASYGQVCDLMNDYLGKLTLHEQELIWGKNAAMFYKL